MGQLSGKIIEMPEASHLINHHCLSRRGNILDKEAKGDEEDAQRRHAPLPCHARTITIKSDVWGKEKTSPRKVRGLKSEAKE